MGAGELKGLIIGLVLFVLFSWLILNVAVDFGAEYDRDASEIGDGSLNIAEFQTSAESVEGSAQGYRSRFESGEVDDIAAMHSRFLHISQELDLDVAVQEDNLYRRSRRLVCFDMDSTLIQVEVIDELAKAAGVGEQVAAITESAMQGKIDFSESFRQRMALLEGMDESVLKEIAENLPVTEGAARLISHLHHFGYKIAILSGGFTYFANYLKEKLGIDYVYANQLDFKNGKLSGKVKGDIIDGQMKAKLLVKLAAEEGISTEQVIAVGDGANDLPMLAIAGLGIAFHAKPIVKEQAQHSIAHLGLDAILYLLGMRDRELAELENIK